MPIKPEIAVFDTPAALFQGAADEFSELAADAVRKTGRFTVALSGGSTPKSLYSLLATEKADSLPWEKIFFFFGDERHVPPDHADSNYRMANQALLSRVAVPRENVFRVPAEDASAEVAAQKYEDSLKKFFGKPSGQIPVFDLIFLGVGPDGHTASLFPGTKALMEKKRWVVANHVDKLDSDRITFTYPLINNAACVTFLSSGADKAATLHEVLDNPDAGLPSQAVQPTHGRLVWMIDRAAAGRVTSK